MQDHHHSLLRLLNASDVREQTRAVFKSLIEHCEDEERLCSFVLESVRDRVSESLQSEIVRRRSCGSPAFPLPKELRVILESEALNDEARRWMADFLLYPIGKRTKTTRRSTRLLDKRNRHTHATRFKNTCYEPQLASTEDCGRFCEVELFPKSNDSVRFVC
ncbi:hypothetical protein FS842_008344 [Serendipita sp. 407]|nr:hypothetical protein FS842_008344 [Serendipita sp. 407]